jgi:hypothetical protein
MLSKFKTPLLAFAFSATGLGVLESWLYRPIPLLDNELKESYSQHSKRKFKLTDFADSSLPFWYNISRKFVVAFQVSISRFFLCCCGSFFLIEDKNYLHFLEKIINRDKDTPLITVSNHRSLVDDPTIFSSILPFWMNIQHKYLRYSLCAQEYCFNEKVLDAFIV